MWINLHLSQTLHIHITEGSFRDQDASLVLTLDEYTPYFTFTTFLELENIFRHIEDNFLLQ